MARDIFKDGLSPELEAEWNRLETLEKKLYSIEDPVEREIFLGANPELIKIVTCEGCGQIYPKPRLGL